MEKLHRKWKGIPVWIIVVAMAVSIVAATAVIISNIWISPKVTVAPLPLVLSSDLTADQTIQPEVPLEFHMTLENPNRAYTYTSVHVIVEIRDLSDNQMSPNDVLAQYYDPTATPGYEWKTITFEQRTEDGNTYLYHDWSGATPFNMPPGSITILFRTTYHTSGQYQATVYAVQG
jgi:hypothetical protein